MLTPRQLLMGYAQGIFPMAAGADDPVLHWFDPPNRGILPVGGVHVSRSLRRALRQDGWSAHLDADFDAMVAACASRDETWINEPLADLYSQLHQSGHASALEVRQDGVFAGGVFGVTLGGAFFGESMVSTRTNGSKIALVWISSHLARCGFTLFDTQFLTPHLARMGGTEITRASYRRRLAKALQQDVSLSAQPLLGADQLWQEITQTS